MLMGKSEETRYRGSYLCDAIPTDLEDDSNNTTCWRLDIHFNRHFRAVFKIRFFPSSASSSSTVREMIGMIYTTISKLSLLEEF